MKNWKQGTFAVLTATLAIAALIIACENPFDTPSAHVHQWGAWTTTTAATCTTTGTQTRTCTLDTTHKEIRAIEINPNAHNYQNFIQTTAPTCLVAGEETGTCTYNRSHKRTRPITALGHDWKAGDNVETPPTCTEDGVGARVCKRCIITEPHGVIPALGHDFQNYVQTKAPTCTVAGEETGTCTRDSSHTTTRTGVAIDPNAHNYRWVATTASTFIEEGVEKEVCSHNSSHTRATRTTDPLPITTTHEWNSALALLNRKTGSYTLTIGGNFAVAGSTNASFGYYSYPLTVTLKGSGTLSLNSQGNLICIYYGQTLIIDSADLILRGLTKGQNGATQDNNTSVVYVEGGALELRDGTISGNTSNHSGGGGVYMDGYDGTGGYLGTFKMTGGTISGNTATGGGGVVLDRRTTFTMTGGTISGNTASMSYANTSSGGGVYVAGEGTFIMEGGEISGNTAQSLEYPSSPYIRGGGVYVYYNGNFTMSGGTISGNTANNGGGVYVDDDATFTMSSSTAKISGNTAQFGGGVYTASKTTFTMNGGEIIDNTAQVGGGVYAYGDNFTMNGTAKISGNTARPYPTYGYGGGVYSGSQTTFTMNDGEITDNTAFNGGGVYAFAFTMNGGTISGNTAAPIAVNYTGSSGGGVYMIASFTMIGGVYMTASFTMIGGTISGNTVIDGYGGGVGTAINGGDFMAQFTKTGGIIYGYSESDTVNSNTVKNSSGAVLNDRGHAIRIAHSVDSYIRRKEITSQHEDNLSCVWNVSLSFIEGVWDQ